MHLRSERLNAKTLDQMFLNMVEQGYECPQFVSNAILETAKPEFIPEQSNPTVMNVGQLKVLGIAASEPAGKPLAKCEMKTAVVTLDAGKKDEEIRSKYGLAALRQARLAKVTHEAWDQGVSLTQEDIAAKLLNCGVRTVRRDIKALAKRGVIVPTRGQQKGIGPGVSHKLETFRLFMERRTYTEIERTLKHSLTAIKRYILTFSRVAYLTEKGGGDKLSMNTRQSIYAPLLDKTFAIDISAISTVCASALRKDCQWKRPHSLKFLSLLSFST